MEMVLAHALTWLYSSRGHPGCATVNSKQPRPCPGTIPAWEATSIRGWGKNKEICGTVKSAGFVVGETWRTHFWRGGCGTCPHWAWTTERGIWGWEFQPISSRYALKWGFSNIRDHPKVGHNPISGGSPFVSMCILSI